MNNLSKLVDQINGLDSNKYNESTWNAMLPVLQNAEDTLKNEKNIYTDLITAFLNLRLKPDKDSLDSY